MIKKILTTVILGLICVTAIAHDGFRREGYYRSGGGWVGPAIIGGVIGYELGRPRYEVYPPVVVQQPPPVIYTTPQPIIVQSNCTVWTETQHPDGTITRTRTCTQ